MPEIMEAKNTPSTQADRIIELILPMIAPLGYEVVSAEVHNQHQKTLRLFIDFSQSTEGRSIGIEDCVIVSRALDEPLENNAEVDAIFKGAYELEVSSPGVDRPLRTEKDFERFSGREAKIHVFRPLTAVELENPGYQQKNPKQKNFSGILKGVRGGKALLVMNASASTEKAGKPSSRKNSKEKKAEPQTNSVEEVSIPLPLISKANLEPKFEFDERE